MSKILRLGWFYPDQLSLYGDRGNIKILFNRCFSRGINCIVDYIGFGDRFAEKDYDLVFMGGGADFSQSLIYEDFIKTKKDNLESFLKSKGVGLFVCGAYQLMGHFYKNQTGLVTEGISLFDMYTQSRTPRCTGRIVCQLPEPILGKKYLFGFENHSGRTFITNNDFRFSRVLLGKGNNGFDRFEGYCKDNFIGTYLHGPILALNPFLADWMISTAFKRKFSDELLTIQLPEDALIYRARANLFLKSFFSFVNC